MKWVEHSLLALLTAAAVFVAVEMGLALREVRIATIQIKNDAHAEAQKIDAVLTDVSRTTVIAAGAVTNIEKGTRRFQTEQKAEADAILRLTNSSESDTRELAILLSTGTSQLQQLGPSLTSLQQEATRSLTTANTFIASLQAPTGETLKNLSTASKSLELTSVELASTSQHVDKMTADAQKVSDMYADKLLHPKKGIKSRIESFGKLALLGLRAWLAWP